MYVSYAAATGIRINVNAVLGIKEENPLRQFARASGRCCFFHRYPARNIFAEDNAHGKVRTIRTTSN